LARKSSRRIRPGSEQSAPRRVDGVYRVGLNQRNGHLAAVACRMNEHVHFRRRQEQASPSGPPARAHSLRPVARSNRYDDSLAAFRIPDGYQNAFNHPFSTLLLGTTLLSRSSGGAREVRVRQATSSRRLKPHASLVRRPDPASSAFSSQATVATPSAPVSLVSTYGADHIIV